MTKEVNKNDTVIKKYVIFNDDSHYDSHCALIILAFVLIASILIVEPFSLIATNIILVLTDYIIVRFVLLILYLKILLFSKDYYLHPTQYVI